MHYNFITFVSPEKGYVEEFQSYINWDNGDNRSQHPWTERTRILLRDLKLGTSFRILDKEGRTPTYEKINVICDLIPSYDHNGIIPVRHSDRPKLILLPLKDETLQIRSIGDSEDNPARPEVITMSKDLGSLVLCYSHANADIRFSNPNYETRKALLKNLKRLEY